MTANSSSPPGLKFVVLGALALMVGLLAALWLQKPATISLQSGTLLQAPRPLGDFSAVDENGQPFGLQQLQGHWTLIFPGFTSCPDVCPTTLAMLHQVFQQLGSDAAQMQVRFFSVDPERDTPEKLTQYVHAFDPQFTAMTAHGDELPKLARMLGVAYAKVPGGTPGSYTMDHSAALILIDPQGRIAGYLTPPFAADKLVADLHTVLQRS
ncbi:SCO family protein [Solimonas marina]|uniref:SCO family protein n=1 Tax=Solimonas marina TaxID=2714601 RepID=A0A969WAR9_9GAMM|nr:SCO family protein [Solimonas marina]NKF22699.1 SCO family protein [Solimonas marina]